jgi:hypothetical protein
LPVSALAGVGHLTVRDWALEHLPEVGWCRLNQLNPR